jgi:hypothetical protein
MAEMWLGYPIEYEHWPKEPKACHLLAYERLQDGTTSR